MQIQRGQDGVYELFADCNRNQRYESGSDIRLSQVTMTNVEVLSSTPRHQNGWLEVIYIPPNPLVSIRGSLTTTDFSFELRHRDNSSLIRYVAGNNSGNVEIQ